MSSTAPKSSFAATLGLILVLITSAFLLTGMGVFSVQLLAGILVPPPEQPSAEPAAAPATPGAAAAPVAAAAPAVDPAVAALLAAGKETFQLCAACHGPEGKAIVPNMAPNLAGSAYVNGPSERLSMLVLNGIQFPGTYMGQMISWKATLTDEQIAGVLTYVRASFGNSASPITPAMIKGAREKHGPRNTPYSRAELDQVVTDLK
jgi:mono/diheme cytochrome c family protein